MRGRRRDMNRMKRTWRNMNRRMLKELQELYDGADSEIRQLYEVSARTRKRHNNLAVMMNDPIGNGRLMYDLDRIIDRRDPRMRRSSAIRENDVMGVDLRPRIRLLSLMGVDTPDGTTLG